MILIIAEKSIAGERIAQVLSDSPIKMNQRGHAKSFSFTRQGKEHMVLPLRGHVVEVNFPPRFSYWKGTDLQTLVQAPIDYLPSDPAIASLLREMGKKATLVIIATDADREGESIGVEALRILQETNPHVKVERAYFSAMTPKELQKSFSTLSPVDYHLSDSADSRREIDLVWGAVLTRFVSLMANRVGKEFISVGRVQTPVLAIIVNREKERQAFQIKPFWELIAHAEKDNISFDATHARGKFWEEEKAKSIHDKLLNTHQGVVKKVTKRQRTIAKPLPFNTTQFLRSATVLGLSAGQAMNIAESLYMQGYISYPRTDNTVYPNTLDLHELLGELKAHPAYIPFVDQILQKPLSPSGGAKESKDHPPIHPTKIPPHHRLSEKEWKVFDLIARRFLATFLEAAHTENMNVELSILDEPFIANGQTILSPGWKAVYPYSVLKEVILPSLKSGDVVAIKKIDFLKKETVPPTRYSQSGLLKIMEDQGLGTKSTRHSVIQKLYSRKYISGLKSVEPNQIAFAVIDSLERHCEIVTQPKMTADLEKEMDQVADGQKKKELVVDDSRKMLKDVLAQLLQHKMDIAVELKKAFIHQDVLAICPRDQGNLVIRRAGATGKRFLGCSNYPNCTQTYPLPQKGNLSSLKKECTHCHAPMILLTGSRFKLEICLNMDCPSKDEWKRKQAAIALASAAAPKTSPSSPSPPNPSFPPPSAPPKTLSHSRSASPSRKQPKKSPLPPEDV
ncbi:MAG: DNA topoisomerase I [Candidatus Diapherotrites archaeon]|nr:DNA topoisomerase I [Candidatus Diapherotrites archaeon]MDZ4256602.1 DNA topoisomerase I [archaeon]